MKSMNSKLDDLRMACIQALLENVHRCSLDVMKVLHVISTQEHLIIVEGALKIVCGGLPGKILNLLLKNM